MRAIDLALGPQLESQSRDEAQVCFTVSLETLLRLATWYLGTSQVVLGVKNLPANAGHIRDMGSVPGFGKIPWRRA